MDSLTKSEPADRCPAQDALFDFNLGRLPADVLDAISAHLSRCPTCAAALDNLQGQAVEDSIIARLTQCLAQTPFPDEPAYARMEAAARALGESCDSRPTLSLVKRPPAPDRLIGTTIGSYLILARIGGGGMGVVYRAQPTTGDRPVALKMIRGGLHASEELVARFATEAQAVERLQHPNVVQVHEVGEHEGLPYLSMELIGGGSLKDKLEHGPLPPRQAAELVRTLSGAVARAHDKQVLHRDLKPGNILLTEEGIPKIADFGLAKLLDSEATGHTRTDAVLGTPNYMAPEQAAGQSKAVGPPADIYALGAILYEALTGVRPFVAANRDQVLKLVCQSEPIPPSRHNAGIPAALEDICLKCLEKAPARRYPSAQALADDLERWLAHQRLRGTPRWQERLGRALWRRKAVVAGGLLLAVAAALLYLSDPKRPLRQLEADLAAGQPVTLIGETGKPKWFRWRMGAAKSATSLAQDGAFSIHTQTLVLIELLPDPQTERYRFAAQVRHNTSNRVGGVGLFVAHQAYPGGQTDFQFFTQMIFDDVLRVSDVPVMLPNGKQLPRRKNIVQMFSRLHSEEGARPEIDWPMVSWPGPQFEPAGESRTGWHDLAMTVAPDGISAEWDGQLFRISRQAFLHAVDDKMTYMRRDFPDNPFVQRLQPQYAPRGGLGLFLWRGSASYRAATVTPLQENH